jgi:polysaccharide export outer membrane protein
MMWLAGVTLLGCQSAAISQSSVVRAQAVMPAVGIVGPTDYHLGPLDLLDIEVLGSPELTRTMRVSASGEISMPLIGRVTARDRSIAELQDEIAKLLSAKYYENPQVTVFVKEYMSQRVTVEGAVRQPGVFSLTGRTSLLQLVAMSGGMEREANPGGVVVYRNIGDRRHAAIFDMRKIRAGSIVDPEVLGGDVVVIDFSGMRATLRDLLSASPLLAVFLAI